MKGWFYEKNENGIRLLSEPETFNFHNSHLTDIDKKILHHHK